ncbi:MAG TPA: DUF3052 domain-containing protein [Cyclobacteriaceae bacterium]|nr:DUF3052 domain-containing protein [Cyclobacteriaceae bacterium]HRJ81171.1 DUF3052 domain-containing protein [Cyclobacteriaceae bacterium]
MAGYSGTPLLKKLGIKAGYQVYVLNPPPDYFDLISPLPDDVHVMEMLKGESDMIHLFTSSRSDFEKAFLRAKKHLKKTGMIWVSWPKKSAKIPTDLDENVVREFGLKHGLVDVKVCAVNEIWSGLKFVFRVADR